jgi:hypothetical protein
VALALVYIWILQPTRIDAIRIPFITIVVLIPIASALWHRDRLPELGLRLDNLATSVKEIGIATAIGAVLILAIGLPAGGGRAWSGMWSGLATYPFWGLAQQYAMQSFTYRRLREGWGRPGAAAAGAAILFGVAHWPNVALALVTAVGGYVWCRLFERHPNLLTLALSHGWLAVLVRWAWPAEWLHNLRIEPSFWTWTP